MKRMMKRLAALMAVFLMGIGCIAPAQTAYAANFITFNQTIQDSYGVKTSVFKVDNAYAFCCEAMKPTPYRDMQVYISESKDPELLKVLWYGVKGPGAVLADNNDGYMKTSQAASQALGNGRVNSRYEAWYKQVITYAAPPSGFKAYIATPVNTTYQALAFSVYYPEGSAYLTKSSSDSTFSSGSGYSLANAVYGVYSNSACTSEVATFTTNSSGVSNTITLDAGTYYVKEKTAPQGFELDTTVHKLVVVSGSTKNLTVTDIPKGRLKLQKQSSNADFSSGSEYSLAGAEYKVYSDSACTNAVGSFTTDANGNTGEIILSQGTYYVKETKAPQGFELDTTAYSVTVTAATTKTLTVTDVPKGKLTLVKESADTNVSTGDKYSLKGAEYKVYSDSSCTNEVGSFVTDSRGMTDEIMLGAGTYYVKETKAPMGFALDTTVHSVSVVAGQVNTFRAKDVPLQGKLSIIKKSSNPEITDGNSCYSLENAKFGVYKDVAKTQLVGTLITNANGKTAELTLPLGTYYVKEMEAPKGFAICDDFSVEVVAEGIVKEVMDNPQDDPVSVLLQKVDAATGKPVAVGGASLEGAEYTFRFYDGIYDADPAKEGKKPLRSWVFRTNKNGYIAFNETFKASGDAFYYNDDGIPTLPLGTLTIQETKAPKGYKINPEVYVRTITAEGTSDMVNTYNQPITPESIQRGDLEFVKIDAKTQKRMANVKFRLTEITTGESHILITDGNGKASTASSWNKHSNHTNRGTSSSDGIWFGLDSEGNVAPVDDNVGALPYGTYKLEELQCAANKGYDLFEAITFKIDSDKKVVNLGSLENHFVELDTVALNKTTNSHHARAKGEVTIVDTVYYEGLTVGKTYKLVSKVIDVATGTVLKSNGKEMSSEKEFSPTAAKSSEKVSFTFNAENFEGKTVVVTQELYREGILISSHNNLDDEDQMVRFPKIGTNASNAQTGNKLVYAGSEFTIKDNVAYENLIPNKDYVLTGKLMNADTGESIKVNGKEVIVEKQFRARQSNGTEAVKFVLNDSKLAGYTITVYEVLSDGNGAILASHEVLNDSAQTVYIPRIGTSAISSTTNEKMMKADKNAVINDRVEYSGLMPGKEYTVSGVLMDKETGKALIVDGKQVTASKKFTAAAKNGSVEMVFSFNATGLAGKSAVVFEDLYFENALVASHRDIKDEGQTVHIPKISTSAVEGTFNSHVAIPTEKAVITDTVTYTNLLAGKEYTVNGILMDKATGKALLVNGKEVTASKSFVPTSANGSVDIVFEFDSSALIGKILVVFESLNYKGKEIAVHKDINDANQTIYYQSIETSAVESSFGTHVALAKKNTVITDTVSYKNLPVGEKFTVKGILMDKETGKALLVNGKEVTAEKEFTAASNNGSVKLEFKFDSTGLEGTTIVVFETLLKNGSEIAAHKDINDSKQSIYYPNIGTSAVEGSMNDHIAVPKKDAVITDTVTYTNLPVGETFKLEGVLMNKATGKALLVDGKKVTAEKEFTTTTENGSVNLEFKFDASELEGATVVVFESLVYKRSEIAAHEDIGDVKQSIYYPSIKTSAKEGSFNEQVAVPKEETVITDTISFTDLQVGRRYTVKGILMDKKTGKALLVNGKEVTAEKEFTPSRNSGTVDVEFRFDSTALAGKTVVVYESLYFKGTEIAVHKDINDEGQTIYYPNISTSATESTFDKQVAIPSEQTVITDKVTYSNLSPDKEYTVKGVLMDKKTGKPLLVGGREITAEKKFVPESANGSVEITFTFDSSLLEDKTVVVFESLYYKNVEITVHKDIEDNKQSIYYPNIGTMAIEGTLNDHVAVPKQDTVITDTVTYTNLPVGETFKISGILMDKSTGKALLVDGKEVTATKTFRTVKDHGIVELDFKFDSTSLKGKTIVVFEELLFEETVVTSHKDINDGGQTIYYPMINTSAIESTFDSQVAVPNEKTVITDTVSYTNLMPGKEYTVKGVLMNKATGEKLLVDGKEITSEKTFTAASTNGTVELTFTFDSSALKGSTVVVFETLYYKNVEITVHKDIEDNKQSIYYPSIGTMAIEGSLDDHVAIPKKDAVITDTVTYTNLPIGEMFTLNGILMDKSTGSPLLVDGKEITATLTFTTTKSNASEKLIFNFDASALKGTTVVVFETLTYNGMEVAFHKDINDEGQTVYYPEISTSAVENTFDKHVAVPNEKTVITDTVSYTNLMPGKEYTVKGVLMNKESGKPLLVDGKEVTATKKFIPTSTDGNVELVFTFDSSALKGETVVVFESLYYKDTELTVHKDIEDNKQSIYYPSIGTMAVENSFNTHMALSKKDTVITDTVSYTNLPVGETFKMRGTLMNKATGKALLVNGKEVTAEKEFKTVNGSGTVEMKFAFDSSSLEGVTVVVFEELIYENTVVTVHKDINDSKQSIYYPSIGTMAIEGSFNDHIAIPKGKAVITDTVAYKDMPVGVELTVKGILMDKATGKALLVNGKEVTATKSFTTKANDGTVELEFKFDASALKGKTVVVFETLTYNGKEVASHKDLNDKGQTIYYPEISTSAVEDTFNKHVAVPNEKTVIIDTVSYTNLMPGKEYTVKGVLMNKESGKPLLVDGKEVAATKKFVPTSVNGSIDLKFEFDSSALKGKTVVVFESLYYKGTEITVHKDINDVKQSIFYPSIRTMAVENSFGDHMALAKKDTVITDKVSYTDLPVGETFKVRGTLMNKATGKAILVNGKEVTAEKEFKAVSNSGTVELKFAFDASGLKDVTVVVFEELIYEEKVVTAHKDINDSNQSIYYPRIGTSAIEGKFNDRVAIPNGKARITDTVAYKNMPVGAELTVKGILMDKATGKALLINGKEVTATKTFTTKANAGTVELEFKFDASAIEGTTVVVFEEVVYKNKVVAEHKDITDEGQTVYFPKIRTEASEDSFTIGNLAVPNETMTIKDKVSFTNLLPGREYTVSGVLMNKETGKPLLVNDKEIHAERTFTAASTEGFVELEFKLDASSLAGTVIVVFEELLFNDTVVVTHKDLEDAAQTIFIPIIHTNAIDKNSETQESIVEENNVIIDTVTFKSLVSGEEYTVKGYLVDKATKEPLMEDGKRIESEVTFKAETNDGEVKVDFVVPGNIAGGKEIVVFEELYYEDTLIASHKDINDFNQTVKYDYTSVIVNKTDKKTEEGLAGAKLQLIELVKDEEASTDENIVYKEVIVEEWITDGKPYECKNIKNGLYVIREVETPIGYATCEDLSFEKENAYDNLELDVKDDIIKLEISKKDSVDNAEIKGAKMQLIDKDGKVVEEWTTDGNVHYIEYLPVGTYTLVEKEAPFGYVLSEPVTFEVKDTAEVQFVEMLDARTQGYIEIEKLSSVNRTALAGAEFEFRNKDGEVIDILVSDENGNAKSKHVDIGIYENGEFKEFAVYYLQETTAPEGYELDDTVYEITFGYLGDSVPVVYKHYKIPNVKIVVEEPELELVPTGDNTQYLTYFALMAAAFATMLVVLKKRTIKEN